jgi:protease I
MPVLSKHRVAILATDGFEELELIEPLRALRTEGAEVDIISTKEGPIQGMHLHHKTIRLHVDRVLRDTVLADQYDALVIPGGPINGDALRANPLVRKFIFTLHEGEKPIAAVGHAAWLLVSAGIVSGRRITSFPSLRDDLVNAGAHWIDEAVVIDGNLITSRSSQDLAAFDIAIVEEFSQRHGLISPETRHLFARSRIA